MPKHIIFFIFKTNIEQNKLEWLYIHKWALHFCVKMNYNHNGGKMGSFLKKYPWGNQISRQESGLFESAKITVFANKIIKFILKINIKQYWMESGYTFIK